MGSDRETLAVPFVDHTSVVSVQWHFEATEAEDSGVEMAVFRSYLLSGTVLREQPSAEKTVAGCK